MSELSMSMFSSIKELKKAQAERYINENWHSIVEVHGLEIGEDKVIAIVDLILDEIIQ